MRICINLFPFRAGGGGGIETFCRWVVDIPRHVPTTHEFEVLLNPSVGLVSRRIERGRPFDPFAVPEGSIKAKSHPLRRIYEHRLVPEALRRAWRALRRRAAPANLSEPATRRAWLESRGFDLVHCPYQVLDPRPPDHARLPCCINLHDLQHEHFPQFFTAEELAFRREFFRKSAELAAGIFVVAEHVKADVVHFLGIQPEKIRVVWPGPPFEGLPGVTDARRAEVRRQYALPERFCYYPAVTWEHKNHARLLQALARLRERRGPCVPFVFSGSPGPAQAALQAEAARLGLEDQLRWLGYVPYGDVRALYTLADATVAPTLYEASSAPVYEALAMGCPAACSAVANLPWLLDNGRAGLLFDPLDVEAIADALRRLWEDAELRKRLAAAGPERVKAFSWKAFAEGYLRGYEQAASGARR